MTLVALAEAVALVVVSLAFLNALRAQQRAHVRRADLLLNQLLHAVGKPWQPAPADARDEPHDTELESARYTATPEQFV